MGKKNWKKNRGPRTENRRENSRWVSYVTENPSFEAYYKAQNVVPEEEWDEFMKYLKLGLPTTFRLNGARAVAPLLQEQIQKAFVPYLSGIMFEGELVEPPKSLPWYPKEWAWQVNIDKRHIRKNDRFKRLQQFLVLESESGNLSRQEAVSMIPPLLLDVSPEHFILDMCAAPGSKSAQLLEAVMGSPLEGDQETVPKGLLVANDSDAKRCHMLVHQSLRRIPYASMMVTQHDASLLPTMKVRSEVLPEHLQGNGTTDHVQLTFDRILADVPCSGDGTLRKNLPIWQDWNLKNAYCLHELQIRILTRGVYLLRPGGRLVYSTCSLNPIENEAVVSTVLDRYPELKLVDVSDRLPGLIRRPGLKSWKVYKQDMSGEAVKDEDKLPLTMWPNGHEEEHNVDRCLRIYPHLQDTGGFFVAVFEKSTDAPLRYRQQIHKRRIEGVDPAAKRQNTESSTVDGEIDVEIDVNPETQEPEAVTMTTEETVVLEGNPDSQEKVNEASMEEPQTQDKDNNIKEGASEGDKKEARPPRKEKRGGNEFKEEPYTYVDPANADVQQCIEFFGLKPSFPTDCLLVRNSDGIPQRSMYLTSPAVKAIVQSNTHERLRLVSCGVKILARDNRGETRDQREAMYTCRWRVTYDGLEALMPFLSEKRIVHGTAASLELFMKNQSVENSVFSAVDSSLASQIDALSTGSAVLIVDAMLHETETLQTLHLPIWKSKASVSLMIDRNDKNALSVRLYGIPLPPKANQNHSNGSANPAQVKQASEAIEEATKEAEIEDAETTTAELEDAGVPKEEIEDAVAADAETTNDPKA